MAQKKVPHPERERSEQSRPHPERERSEQSRDATRSSRSPQHVLFVCTFNSARSPIAAALVTRHLGLDRDVESAGVYADPIDPFAVATMAELDIDLVGHEPRALAELDPARYGVVIALSPEAHGAVLDWKGNAVCHVEYWPVVDPAAREGSRAERVETYRLMRGDLLRRIRHRFA
jgi:protein-tyrosine-phosphatase